ncbi:MAG TPA: hypothetical protein VKU85_08900 [bacterium]|nr:hypothetical protein [bacterium]
MYRRALPLALLGAALAAPAAALQIDTFEVGPFSKTLLSPGTSFLFQTVNAPLHTISAQRRVTLNYFAGSTGALSADLTPVGPDDSVDMSFTTGPSYVQFTYDGGLWDLTTSGANQQLVIRMENPGPSSGQIEVWLTDWVGKKKQVFQSGPATIFYFPLISFTGVDVAHTIQIDVYFHSTQPASWSVSDIRTEPSPYAGIDWDSLRDWIEICPLCPPDPCTFDWDILTNPVMPVMGPEITMSMVASGLELVRFNSFDSGGDLGIGGPVAMMNMMWMSSGPFQDGTLTFDVMFPSSSGFTPALSGPPGVTHPPDCITPGANGFALTAPVVATDDAGTVLGSTVQNLMVSSAPGQDLCFSNVMVTETLARAAATGYRLSFDVEAVDVDEAEPILEVYLTGGWTSGMQPTDAPAVAAADAEPGLRALPTVSRDVTTLELQRPAAAAGAIAIFDVRGRLTRRLPVAAGARAAAWNGRDDSGQPVAAGVYLARWPGDGSAKPATARIIRLR